MTQAPAGIEIAREDRADGGRYVARLDGAEAGQLVYRRPAPGELTIVHTRTLPELQGRGVAAALTLRAAQDARAEGLRVTATCSYAAAWLQRHPEWADMRGGA